MTTADQGRIDPAAAKARVAALYECYAEELRLFLTGVLRNADLADEALQNTFAKAVESGHTAREESVKGWLFQVAFNEAILLRRRGQVHTRSLRQLVQRVSSEGPDRPDDRVGPLPKRSEQRAPRPWPNFPPTSGKSSRCGFTKRKPLPRLRTNCRPRWERS